MCLKSLVFLVPILSLFLTISGRHFEDILTVGKYTTKSLQNCLRHTLQNTVRASLTQYNREVFYCAMVKWSPCRRMKEYMSHHLPPSTSKICATTTIRAIPRHFGYKITTLPEFQLNLTFLSFHLPGIGPGCTFRQMWVSHTLGVFNAGKENVDSLID